MMKKTIAIFILLIYAVNSQAQKKINLSLSEAIQFAVENSYNTKVAKNEVLAAKKKVWETTTIGLPQINAQVDYQNWLKQLVSVADLNGDGVNEEFVFGTQQTLTPTITLNQLVFDGSYLVGLQSAKTYLKISEQAAEKTITLTKEAVINAYGNVLVAEKSIEILERNKEVLEKNLSDVTKIYNNGMNEKEDVEQLEITLGTLNSQLNNVKRLKAIGYQMLNITIGKDIATKLTLTDTLESLTTKNMDLSLFTSNFNIDNHIDFRIAENTKEANRLLMQYERRMALPSINAFVNYGTTGNSNSFTFFDNDQRWFQSSLVGVSIRVPIFTSFQRSAKIAQAKIEFENSDIRLKETKQQLSLQAAQAKSNYQLSIENYETAKKNLSLSESIESKQRIKFFEGLSTSFELASAQNQLYTQQQNYLQSMLDVINKKAALENALNLPIN